MPLVDQMQQWATSAADVVPHPVGETLTTWWIGINDTGDTVGNASVRRPASSYVYLSLS